MSDIHLSRDLLAAYRQGRIDHREFSAIAMQHLSHLCPHCRDEMVLAQASQHSSGALLASMASTVEHLTQQETAVEKEFQRAEQDVQTLLRLPPEKRTERVRRARTRFRSFFLVEALIREGRHQLHDDPRQAEDVLRLGVEVLGRIAAQGSRHHEFLVRAYAHIANAQRVRGDLRSADESLHTVRSLVRVSGVTDSLVLAELDSLEGSLRRDQRKFRLSETLLQRAALLYSLCEEERLTARTLIKLGYLYSDAFQDEKAIATTQRGLAPLNWDEDASLVLCGHHNLAWSFCNQGRFDTAQQVVREIQQLYQQFTDPWTVGRFHWLDARIAVGLLRFEEADGAYTAAREGFLDNSYEYDVALVTLDHATLYLQQGRLSDLKALAEGLTVIFSARQLHHEATAALLLFQQAARQESLTGTFLMRLSRYLHLARTLPEMRFRPS
jgi:tetratricopeptide (TPR) repeat protein